MSRAVRTVFTIPSSPSARPPARACPTTTTTSDTSWPWLLIKSSSINFLLLNVGTTDSSQWQRSLQVACFRTRKTDRIPTSSLDDGSCTERTHVRRVWTRHKLLESENRSGIAVFLVSIFLFLRRRVSPPPPPRSRLNIKSMERIERHVCRVGDTRGMKSPPTRRS